MPLITEALAIQFIKDELSAGIVNVEIDDDNIKRNISRALMFSGDYFNYTAYKTMPVVKSSGSSGYILLSDIDPTGIPYINAVFPTKNVLNLDAALLGLGSVFISASHALNPQLNAYSNMVNKLSQLESILGRNARVVGDKLHVAHNFGDVTIEYVPAVPTLEDVNEGDWVRFLVDYSAALCKRQIANSRGKYVVSSNPAEINAADLADQATEKINQLEEEIKTKGLILASR